MTHSFYRSYGFLAAMLACIVLGCAVGAAWPGAVCLEPLGTVFINMMFCLVVPLVFCSLAGSIANTRSRRRAGRILGATLGVFVVTGLLAAFIMLVIVRVFPPVLTPWTDAAAGTVDDPAPLATLLVNFFTVNDFSALLSRRAMLPLIVFSLLFGFSVSACGGPDTVTARVLDDATKCLLKMVSLATARRSRRPMPARCWPTTRSASSMRCSPSRFWRISAAGARGCGGCGGISCAPR